MLPIGVLLICGASDVLTGVSLARSCRMVIQEGLSSRMVALGTTWPAEAAAGRLWNPRRAAGRGMGWSVSLALTFLQRVLAGELQLSHP